MFALGKQRWNSVGLLTIILFINYNYLVYTLDNGFELIYTK
jgi:hypothetical protein